MFRNILVSVDGTAAAERALMEAIDLARENRARLTILTAVPKPPGWLCTPSTACASGQLAIDFERQATQVLRDAVERVPQSVPVTKILTHDPIRDALVRETQTGRYDLLVMGCRGRGPVAASLLGSVSRFALKRCGLPVLIFDDREQPMHADPGGQAAAPATWSVGTHHPPGGVGNGPMPAAGPPVA
jgi:nucleotide-binding universal stress UspA family protein